MLRQGLYGRKTEVAIVATMYNEDEKLFDDTMTSVVKNIQHLQSRSKSNTWGAKSWEKIVVCIVADGRGEWCCLSLYSLQLNRMPLSQPNATRRC